MVIFLTATRAIAALFLAFFCAAIIFQIQKSIVILEPTITGTLFMIYFFGMTALIFTDLGKLKIFEIQNGTMLETPNNQEPEQTADKLKKYAKYALYGVIAIYSIITMIND